MRHVFLTIAFLLLGGCLDLTRRTDGEPCRTDDECRGACVDDVCHGFASRPCEVGGATDGKPCLRELAPDETECPLTVLKGTWTCLDGQTSCQVEPTGLRDIPNGCNDDNLGKVDEHDMCDGPLERGFFVEEGEPPRGLVRWAVALADYGVGLAPVDGFARCWEDPGAYSGWRVADTEGIVVGWRYADTCSLPATGDLTDYLGAWVRWDLPELTRADHFNISVLSLRVDRTDMCDERGYTPPSTLVVGIASSTGEFRLRTLDVQDGSRPSAEWPCVPLDAGVNSIYVFSHDGGGCPCESERCNIGSVFSPDVLYVSP